MAIQYDRDELFSDSHKRRRETDHVGSWPRVEQLKIECPLCGSESRCKIGPEGLEYLCFRNAAPGKNATRGFTDEANAEYEHGKAFPKPRAVHVETRREPAPDAKINLALKAMLKLFPLSDVHAAHFEKRGMSADVARATYASMPADKALREQAVRAAMAASGLSRQEIPLASTMAFDSECILIPVIALSGEWVSVKRRYEKGDTRYRGPKGFAPRNHFAQGDVVTDERVWITEGAIKADLSSRRLNAYVIGLDSVSFNHAEAVRDLSLIKAKEVVVAFDADLATNPKVLSARDSLCNELVKAGFDVNIAEWDASLGKGLDDLLTNGGTPETSPLDSVPPPTAPGHGQDHAKPRYDRTDERAMFLAGEKVLIEAGKAKKAKWFKRVRRCGEIEDHMHCSNEDCPSPFKSKKTLVAECPGCSHCSFRYINMIPTALVSLWPEELVWLQIKIDSSDVKDVKNAQAKIKRSLKKVDKDLPKRLRYWRGPGVIGMASADLSDEAKFEQAGYAAKVVPKNKALEYIQNVLKSRARLIRALVKAGDVNALVESPWVEKFVSTTAGKEAKKTIPWLNPKEMRKAYRFQKPGTGIDPNDVTDCCNAIHLHLLKVRGRTLATRLKYPYTFAEGCAILDADEAGTLGSSGVSISERSRRSFARA